MSTNLVGLPFFILTSKVSWITCITTINYRAISLNSLSVAQVDLLEQLRNIIWTAESGGFWFAKLEGTGPFKTFLEFKQSNKVEF